MELQTKDFKKKVLSAKKPILVDFWGSWCIPCKQMEPMMEELAKKQNNIKIFRINVNKNPLIASQHKIMGVPTLVLFQNGKEKARLVGSQTLDLLDKFIIDNLT